MYVDTGMQIHLYIQAAYVIDAFTQNWRDLNFYAFPPIAVILKMIKKIITAKAESIGVVPYWPTHAWFPLFECLLVSKLIIFHPHDEVLSTCSHSQPPRLTLAAGKLSGRRRRCKNGRSRHRLYLHIICALHSVNTLIFILFFIFIYYF